MDLPPICLAWLKNLLSPEELIRMGGWLILVGIVYAETGLLVGFFLPGDSLLFTAGFFVGSGRLPPPAPLPQDPVTGMVLLNVLLMTAAFAGNCTGYWVGSRAGPRLFSRPNSRLFKREHLLKTQELWDRYGGMTIILAEFMPFARTFAPVVAGVAQMPFRRFITFNVLGVFIWVSSMTVLGCVLGRLPWVQHNFEKAILLVIALSVMPAFLHVAKAWLKSRKNREAEAAPEAEGAAPLPQGGTSE